MGLTFFRAILSFLAFLSSEAVAALTFLFCTILFL